MRWIVSKYHALTNWWFDMLRARAERRAIMDMFEMLMAERGCDICDEDPKACICGEMDCGPDCD